MTQNVRFSAICPACGEVELDADQLWLVLTDSTAHVDFLCPRCADHVRLPADDETVEVLAALIPVEEMDVPAEAREQHHGAALTTDDLIDLMLSLDSPAWSAPETAAAA